MAMPIASLSSILNILHKTGAKTAPRIPVITIAATVIDGIPPNCLESSTPTGVVIDFGTKDRSMLFSTLNSLDNVRTLITETVDPIVIPISYPY